jgi:ribosomal protein S18 acetylase RimI-like enzyme
MITTVDIRERRAEDLVPLEGILRRVATDGYPPHRPGGHAPFASANNELRSFVVQIDGDVSGHVAVHEYTARSVMNLAAEALQVRPDQLVAVARLFVDPSARRSGVGRSLVEAATEVSVSLERRAILDVWQELPAAISLYESLGWKRLGTAQIDFRSACTQACVHDGRSISSFVYVAPDR